MIAAVAPLTMTTTARGRLRRIFMSPEPDSEELIEYRRDWHAMCAADENLPPTAYEETDFDCSAVRPRRIGDCQ